MSKIDPEPAVADRNQRLKRQAAYASLTLAIVLALLKAGAAVATGSLALLSSLVDSITDIAASAITFVSVRIATLPPDRDHRFGHGKAESLSALAQAGMVTGSAIFILIEAGRRLWQPVVVTQTGIGMAVMGFAIITTLALVVFQRQVVARTGSQAIAADSLHYQGDLALNLSVMASLWLVAGPGYAWADPIIAVLIAAYLLGHALMIARGAIKTLMDHELSQTERDRIKSIIRSHSEIEDVHDLRTREAGDTVFIECHVELEGTMSLARVHDIIDHIEDELLTAYPGAEIIIHQEPAGISDKRLDDVVHNRTS